MSRIAPPRARRSTRRSAITGDFSATYAPYLRRTTYATLRIDRPVFVGTGGQDVDVPTAMQQALVRDACAAGTRIAAKVYPGLDHSATLNASFDDARRFARAVIDNETVSMNCAPQRK